MVIKCLFYCVLKTNLFNTLDLTDEEDATVDTEDGQKTLIKRCILSAMTTLLGQGWNCQEMWSNIIVTSDKVL